MELVDESASILSPGDVYPNLPQRSRNNIARGEDRVSRLVVDLYLSRSFSPGSWRIPSLSLSLSQVQLPYSFLRLGIARSLAERKGNICIRGAFAQKL